MSAFTFSRVAVAVLSLAALLVCPANASAQTSTFVIDFNRTGAPGQECEPVIDPLTGQPVVDANGNPVLQCRAIGGIPNPCTGEVVDVIGSTTMAITTNLTGSGALKVSVSETTKGTGLGQTFLTKYSFSDSQSFKTQFAVGIDPTTITSSSFTDKLFMKGAKSTDNWTIRATFKISINGNGVVTSAISTFTGDVCNG